MRLRSVEKNGTFLKTLTDFYKCYIIHASTKSLFAGKRKAALDEIMNFSDIYDTITSSNV